MPSFKSRPTIMFMALLLSGLSLVTTVSSSLAQAAPEKLPPDIMMDELYGSKGTVFAHGALIMPQGTSVAQGCKGRVKAVVRKSGKIVGSKTLKLSAKRDCWFNGKIPVKARSGLQLTVIFPGNTALAPVTKTFKVSPTPPFPQHG